MCKMLEENNQMYEIRLDGIDERRFKTNTKAYRNTFNFCLRKMIESLNASSESLYKREREFSMFLRLDGALYNAIEINNYANLRSAMKYIPRSIIENAITDSIGFFNKWKRKRTEAQQTVELPSLLSKRLKPFFRIGSSVDVVTFSSKGLYLPKCGKRAHILDLSREEKIKLTGTYKKAKVLYKNLDCNWYCRLDLKNKIESTNFVD